jgi:nucleotide-binding universal stress UspA family protein
MRCRLDGPRFALLGEASAVADAAVWISFLLAAIVAGLLGYTVGKLGVRFPSSGGLIAYLSSHTGQAAPPNIRGPLASAAGDASHPPARALRTGLSRKPDDAARQSSLVAATPVTCEARVERRRSMSLPVLAGYQPETFDRGPVNLAAAATRLTGARLVIVSVYSGGPTMDRLAAGEYAGELSGEADQALEHVKTDLRAQGIDAEVRVIERSSSARGLAAAIEEIQPGLVVVGSTQRGAVGRVLPGSTAERVIHGAPCPVAVAPHGYQHPAEGVRTIGAAFAPTPEGREALRAAALLARTRGARVRVIMVLDPKLAEAQSRGMMALQHRDADPSEDAAGRHVIDAEQSLRDAIEELAQGVDVEPDVLFQDPAEGLKAASENLDLLVIGSRAYGPARAVTLGGVSRQVVASAACPVLVLPRGTEGQIDALVAAADAAAPDVTG